MKLSRRFSAALLLTSALIPIRAYGAEPAPASAGAALPSGGAFTAGAGAIRTAEGLVTVTQTSEAGIVSWDSFSVGAGAAAHFDNGSGATLNRVAGLAPSAIDGSLTATGSLYLVNPAGVVIGADGVVGAGGSFVTSTHDVSDAQFLAGGAMDFRGASTASVVNLGSVSSAQGDVVMIARRVENSGRIEARQGAAALAAGYEVTLTDAADGALSVKIGGADTEAVNAGDILAATVEMRAQGGNVYALAGNTDGIVKAQTVRREGGRIYLSAGEGGSVEVAGTLDASGDTGGAADVTGGEISVSGRIDVSASGDGARGGDAVVFADAGMAFSGTISATGGQGGEGGFVETSGKTAAIADSARVDTRADGGATGEWLVDPADLTVAASGGDMTGAAVAAALATNNFTLDSDGGGSGVNGDIFINDQIEWTSANTLTLDAVRNIEINQSIRGANGGLTIIAGGAIEDPAYIETGVFTLSSGAWTQTAFGSLPGFDAVDFRIDKANSTFLRAFEGGGGADGSAGLPYRIVDIYGLQGMASESLLNSHFVLIGDIDASGTAAWNDGAGFLPIGAGGDPFTGGFDGQDYTIDGLAIDRPTEYRVGLFAEIEASTQSLTISDLTLTNVDITGLNVVGGLAGRGEALNSHTLTVSGVTVDGTVNGVDAVGGLFGLLSTTHGMGVLSDVHADVQVTATGDSAGGLAGSSSNRLTISDSSAAGDVSGVSYVGGLLGNTGATFLRSFATGDVTGGNGDYVGGLAGFAQYGGTDLSYATGTVTHMGADAAYTGGLFGAIFNSPVTRSFATGDVISNGDYAGGLIGRMDGSDPSVENAYALGAVTADNYAGGLIGSLEAGTVASAYSAGAVTATTSAAGGAVGRSANNLGDAYSNVYWDVQTSGESDAIGLNDDSSFSGITARTTAQLQGTLPAGFDAGVWSTAAGLYPYLSDLYLDAPSTIAGFVYSNAGVTAMSGADVSILSGGALLASVTSAANGYYYYQPAPGETDAAGVLSYLDGEAVQGIAFTDILTEDALGGMDIWAGAVRLNTGAASVSATKANLQAVQGSITGADLDILDTTFISIDTEEGAGLILEAASDYLIDQHILSDGLLTLTGGGTFGLLGDHFVGAADGALTVNGDFAWTEDYQLSLSGSGAGGLVLNGAVNAPNGRLSIVFNGASGATATATDAVDVDVFYLYGIDWLQVGAGLPDFTVADFRPDQASFVRALDGDGSVADPYQLFDIYGLQGIYATADAPLNYVLTQDIDASVAAGWDGGAGFDPVPLFGSFDGGGFTIDGLTINRPTDNNVGLFSTIQTGADPITVGDLTLTNVDVTGQTYVSGLVGHAYAYGAGAVTLSDITVSGTVSGGSYVAGVAGAVSANVGGGALTDLHTDVVVTGSGDVAGGLVGDVRYVTVSDSSAVGNVSGGGYAGGLFGISGAQITRSFATGDVSADNAASANFAGGLAGVVIGGSVDLSYATGTVTITAGNTARYAGGLIGSLQSASVSRSYASGDVSADQYVGGLIGQTDGADPSLENVYALGAVTADYYAGGLIGQHNAGTVSTAYSAGAVTASSSAGGVVGYSEFTRGASYTHVYWDTETSGQSGAIGLDADGGFSGITARTTAQLQGTLPAGFDGSVWSTGASLYPYLSDLYVNTPDTISGFVYSDAGVSVMDGADVSILSGGSNIASVTSAANGYYYYQPAPGETDAAGVLSYLDGGAFQGAAYTDTVTAAALGGMDIWAGAFRIATNSAAFSDVSAALATTIGSVSDTDLSFLVNIPDSALRTNGSGAEVDLYLDAGADFLFDMNLFGGGSLTVSTGETFSIDNSPSLQSLEGDLTVNGDFAWNTAATLNLLTAANNSSITLNGDVTAVNGELSIRTAGVVSNVAATATGDIDVGSFYTFGIDWTQVGAGIPSFSAGNFVTDVSSFTRALGGDGSVANPYQLFDIYGLQGVDGSSTSAVNYVLTQDIDASVAAGWDSGAGFRPVDLYGNFDGGGFTIDGLTINRAATTRVGLFSRIRSSEQAITVSDLNLTNVDITGGALAGGLAADIDPSSGGPISLLDITVTGAVTGDSAVGGVAGSFAAGDGGNLATRLHTDVAVTANTGSAGGLMAVGGAALTVSDSSSEGDVSGKSTVGGLLGSTRGSVLRSFATGAVSLDNGATVGGLVGRLLDGGSVDLSYATGDVTHTNGGANVGGLIGWNDDSAVTRSFATGDVTTIEGYNVGGLIGRNTDATVENSYAAGAVSAASEAGGLIGDFASGSLTDSYATGLVTSADADSGGGVAGSAGDPNAVTLSGVFWNTESSGQAGGIGRGDGVTGFTGLTTAQMRQLSTFTDAGWSIDDEGGTASVWRIYDGATAPLLRDFLTDITVTADDQSKTYDGSVFSGGFTYTKSDPAAVLQGSVGGEAATATAAGTHTIGSELYSDQFGYDIDFTAGTLTINAADLNLTIAPEAASKTYGDLLTLTAFDATGLQGGDSIASVTLTSAGTSADADVGAYDITPSNAVFGSGSASNYDITYSVLTDGLTVTPRTLTLGLTGTVEKVYDGDTDAALTLANYSGFDLLFGDTVSLTGFADGAYNTAARDVNKPVSVTGLGLSGADAGNYTLASASVSANVGLITPKTLTFDFVANDKVYTGTTVTSGSLTNLEGVVDGDVFGFSGDVAFENADAGQNKAVTYSNLALHGLDAGNYQLFETSGQTTADITPRALTVTANDDSKTYDGLAYSGGNGVSYSGFINGENASVLGGALVYGGTAQGAVDAGAYSITASGLTSTNYDISFDPGTLTIGTASLNLTIAPEAASKTYGDLLTLTAFGATGLQGGDSIASVTLTSPGTAADADVGAYDITPSNAVFGSGSASNYDITYSVLTDGLTVAQRGLTVTADDLNRTYGDANPALTYTLGGAGLVNGDTLSGDLATAAAASSDVGAYDITQGTLAAGGNYALTFNAGELSVTPRALTVTANDDSRTYDGAAYSGGNGVSYSGFASGDGASDLSGSLVYGGTAQGAVNAGTYSITASGLSSVNYDITFDPGVLTINTASLALAIAPQAASKVYGDTLALTAFDATGLQGGDSIASVTLSSAGTAASADVGSYDITPSNAVFGAGEASNYDITYSVLTDGLTVTQRGLTVTADNQSRIYGDANPGLTYELGGGGLVNGDTLSGALSTVAGPASDVDVYDITQGTLSAGANYALTFVDGELTVTPRALTVTANDDSKIYDGAPYSGGNGVTYSGFASGDDASDLSGSLVYGGSAQGAVNAGTYSITASGLSSTNYAISFNPGALIIDPAVLSLTVTPQAASKIYGESAVLTGFQASGLEGGDSIASVTLTSPGTAAAANVGAYDIAASNAVFGSGSASNYDITYNVLAGGLTVTPRGLTVTADSLSRIYGEANPALTYTLGGAGLVNGDTLSGSLATLAGAFSDVGGYAITRGTLTAGANYALTFNGGQLSVTPRSLTVTVDALSRMYGEANPALTYTLGGDGLVAGDALSGSLATPAGALSGVGTYAITEGTLSAGGNYVLTVNGGGLTVTPRGLIVTANDLSRIYGDANPPLTYTLGGDGLVNGDALSGSLETSADASSGVGAYAIGQGTLGAGANYALSFAGGSLAVTPRPLTIAADDASRDAGADNPVFTYVLGGMGLVNGDTLSGALAAQAGPSSEPGEYAIGLGDLSAGQNYETTFTPGLLTVLPADAPDAPDAPLLSSFIPEPQQPPDYSTLSPEELERLLEECASGVAGAGSAGGVHPCNLSIGPFLTATAQ